MTTMKRRTFLGVAGAFTLGSTLPSTAFSAPRTIRIGLVAPRTGAAAVFNDAMDFALARLLKSNPTVTVNGTPHPYEVIVKDGQTNPNRAAEVAQELILNDKVDLIVCFGTPATVNPVADQCELNGVPCVSNDAPLEPYFFGRNGDPKTGFEWTYHFFFSSQRITQQYVTFWQKLKTDGVVGAMWGNDDDGLAFARMTPPMMEGTKLKLVDPGRFDVGSGSFNTQIAQFKEAGVEIVTGTMIPPEFIQFWTSCAQQGFKPKMVNIGRAYEIPSALESIGDRAYGLSSIVWWSPYHPFASSITGETSKDFAEAYEQASGKPWNVGLGYRHALFEVALDALSRTQDIDDPASIRDAIRATDMTTMVGPVNFSKGPFPNLSETPIVLGQYVKGDRFPLAQQIIDNSLFPEIPVTADPVLIA